MCILSEALLCHVYHVLSFVWIGDVCNTSIRVLILLFVYYFGLALSEAS